MRIRSSSLAPGLGVASFSTACDEAGGEGKDTTGEGEGEGEGEADCPDGDDDGDGICNGDDQCEGDDATGDTDGDGLCDDIDACVGDDATGDTDTDGVCDDLDVCEGDDATGDTDGDGLCDDIDACVGDDATGDTDTDGVCDDLDVCEGDDATGDTDTDDVCDDLDEDDDNDGCLDEDDDAPLVASTDDDGDGVAEDCDLCDGDDSLGDTDGDGICDIPTFLGDSDGDGCVDIFDSDPAVPGTDTDTDGYADECDFCPSDATSPCSVLGVNRDNSDISLYSQIDFEIEATVTVTESSGGTISGFNGLAIDPTTGILYAGMKFNSSRYLAEIDLSTGIATPIGDFGDQVASIAFDDSGTLYAVTGDGGSTSETLYTVDLATGALTSFAVLGNGSDGEAIQYCPDDGLLYHLSGRDSNWAMDSIDLSTATVTPISYVSATDEVRSFAWDELTGTFLLSNIENFADELTTTGTVTNLGTWDASSAGASELKGMVIFP